MIFKLKNYSSIKGRKIDDVFAGVVSKFNLSLSKELMYDSYGDLLEKIKKSDRYFFSDIIASVYQRMYEEGLVDSTILTEALLVCAYHIQREDYSFEGYITKDDEQGLDEDAPIQFRTSFKSGAPISIEDSKITINNKFKSQFEKSQNVFFVAGSQNFQMLNLRMKKTCTLLALLFKSRLIKKDDVQIILSGKNNAFTEHAKVIYSKESHTMKNILEYRLKKYTPEEVGLTPDFFENQVKMEAKSRDTRENIRELIYEIDQLKNPQKTINLFIISSTPHLLQLHESIKKYLPYLFNKYTMHVFLVGSENPTHQFRMHDSMYVKYLMNEIHMRSSVFTNFKKI